jgi:hypothetical protein
MKIEIPKIKKKFKKENFKINPGVYWKTMVILFLVLAVGIAVFAYNLFSQINDDNDSLIAEANQKIEKEKKDKINKVLEYFSERETKSNEILNAPSPVVDPSL